MKRLLLALILLLPRLVSAQTEGELRVQRGGTCERPVMAMNRDSLGLDTLRRIDTVGNDLMALRGAGREGNVILEVAGFGITLGRAPEPEYADVVTRSGRVKLYLFNCGEFGFSQLVGVDYDGYAPEEKGSRPEAGEFNPCRSLGFTGAGCSEPQPYILFCHRFEFCRG
jgi:hypothetical protein